MTGSRRIRFSGNGGRNWTAISALLLLIPLSLVASVGARHGQTWVMALLYVGTFDPSSRMPELNPIRGSYRKLVVRDGVVEAAVLLGDLSRIGLLTQLDDRRTVLGEGEPGSPDLDSCRAAEFVPGR